MPKIDEEFYFQTYKNSLKVPFMIYTDFVSFVKTHKETWALCV